MKTMLNAFYTKPLIIYLTAALLALSTFAGPADAMFVPTASPQDPAAAINASASRAADLAKVQIALESKVIRQKLLDYGLSPEETMARLNTLSDGQIHQLAAQTDSLQAGGDAVGFLIGVMILAILVVVLVFLVQGRIEVRRR